MLTAISSHPSEQEIMGRRKALQSKMADLGLDFYLCHDPDNIFYLTNFANSCMSGP